MREGLDQLIATIDAIGEDMSQLGELGPQLLQQRDGPMEVLDIGLMNAHGKQQAVDIGDDVALASVDAFAGIEAAWAPAFRGRCTLAIDDGGGRRWSAPLRARRTRAAMTLRHTPISRQE